MAYLSLSKYEAGHLINHSHACNPLIGTGEFRKTVSRRSNVVICGFRSTRNLIPLNFGTLRIKLKLREVKKCVEIITRLHAWCIFVHFSKLFHFDERGNNASFELSSKRENGNKTVISISEPKLLRTLIRFSIEERAASEIKMRLTQAFKEERRVNLRS